MIYVISAVIKQGLIVIESLKFLMEDQVCALRKKGLPAFYLNSSLKTEADNIIHFLSQTSSQYIMLFTSPECIFNARLQGVLKKWKNDGKLGFITIDEAHCVYSYSYNISYLKCQEMPSSNKKTVALELGQFTELLSSSLTI